MKQEDVQCLNCPTQLLDEYKMIQNIIEIIRGI